MTVDSLPPTFTRRRVQAGGVVDAPRGSLA
jgi:hypothetical protein